MPRCERSVLDVSRCSDDTRQQPQVFEPMKALMLLARAAETDKSIYHRYKIRYIIERGHLIFTNEVASTMGRPKIRCCPIKDCNYRGGSLKYHLISSRHKKDLNGSDVDAILQFVNRGKPT